MNTNRPGTALLIMDIQQGMMASIPDSTPLLQKIQEVLAGAREKGIPVIYVKLSFREGYPEVNSHNAIFSGLRGSGLFIEGRPEEIIHPAVTPAQGDTVIAKKRFSAFAGNDLDLILRSQGITNLVLTGFSTSGIVLSTVREAADKDYHITVISDGCGDSEADVHDFLVTRIFPKQAAVVTAKEWIATL